MLSWTSSSRLIILIVVGYFANFEVGSYGGRYQLTASRSCNKPSWWLRRATKCRWSVLVVGTRKRRTNIRIQMLRPEHWHSCFVLLVNSAVLGWKVDNVTCARLNHHLLVVSISSERSPVVLIVRHNIYFWVIYDHELIINIHSLLFTIDHVKFNHLDVKLSGLRSCS